MTRSPFVARVAPVALAVLASAACSAPAEEAVAPAVRPLTGLTTAPVAGIDGLGAVRAIAETEATFAVAGARAFALFEKGSDAPRATGAQALVSLAEAPSTVAFATYLAVTADGRLVAVDDDASTTDVTARFGLEAGAVRGATNLGALGVAFVTRDGYAVAAAGTVRAVAQAGVVELFPCGGRLFARAERALYRLDAEAKPAFVTSFPEPLTGAACDASGRVLAATATVLYREVGAALAPLVEQAGFGAIVGVANGNALLRGEDLCLADGAGVSCAAGLAPFTQLFPSRGALPWAVARGALVRVLAEADAGASAEAGVRPDASADAGSPRDGGGGGDAGATRDAGPSADEVAWTQTVKPIAERACFGCHGSVGAASVSLTTHASWVTNRNAIRTRVVTQRNMPPNASSLAAADRAAIATWLGP